MAGPRDQMSAIQSRWATTTGHVAGLALLFVAAGMGLGAIVELLDGSNGGAMVGATAITAGVGFLLWRSTRPGRLDHATVFTAVGGTWLIVSVMGALPYLLAGTFDRPGIGLPVVIADALFESVSGYSASGSTVFGSHNPIDAQGTGLLLYRQLTQWIGGMGIVVLVVTVLPSVRAAGLGLIDAEAPGAGVDRLAPRVADTARRFWLLYLGLTILVAVGLLAAGMGPFDAVAHSLTTTSTGGFSTRDASIGHWDSLAIELVIMLGLVIGAANFTLHARSLGTRRPLHHRDPEFRGYLGVLGVGTLLATLMLCADGYGPATALRNGAFSVVSLGTSGGFGNATTRGGPGDFASWPAGPQVLLLFLLVFGGCTGSTSGGVKVMRLRIGAAHAYRTLRSIRRPRAILPVRFGDLVVADHLVERVAGFVVVYGMFLVGGTLVVAALGSDLLTALSGVFSALGNMGPALNQAGPTASFVDGYSSPGRMVLALLMLVGRLEIFPMLLMVVAPYRAIQRHAPVRRPDRWWRRFPR